MSNENRTPRPRYDLVENPELPPSTSNNDGVPWLNGHHPDANYLGTYHGPNYAVHGQHCDDLYRDNLWSEGAPPPAVDSPNDGVRDRIPPIPDVADAFSTSVPESVSSRMSAMEGLKRLADRYLQDPGSHVDTLSMGVSPSGVRLRVVIILDMDV
ncbi:hypothetical protein EDB84DRAFT_1560455 [Lactarius hengduanensis]|nr:hypothetical protein EDB84DRAFT_1560455 [Lactarius hengduanensis]